MKNLRRLLATFLTLIMLVSTNLTAFASSTTNTINTNASLESTESLIITDTGVYIDGTYYTQEEFTRLLDTAQYIETPQPASAIFLIAGNWWIQGIGKVVITAAKEIFVNASLVSVGTWVYDTVRDWFFTRAFNKSAEDVVNNANPNKQHHIMNSKHNWNKFNRDPKWSDVAPILIKVLQEGTETWEKGNQYIRTLVYQGQVVFVRFMKNADGLIEYLGTAWCQ